ncbi:MAG: helix-turn-helix transcriptional regulator [Paludibacteraceae bacterium]|nr:helix-turn-helix transcriptional regulator [Paludibacteraceae bacterium]
MFITSFGEQNITYRCCSNLRSHLFSQAPITERHLLRLCQQELNMTISEWRNRAKILYAITQLRQGESIKKIGYDLGYNHSSSFIEFFKRYTDQTPNQLKSS